MAPVTTPEWEKAYHEVREGVSRVLSGAEAPNDLAALEALRVRIVGRSGQLSLLLRQLKDLSPEDRRRLGAEANELRQKLEAFLTDRQTALERDAVASDVSGPREDLSLPGRPFGLGRRHPLTVTIERMAGVLSKLGFSWAEGPNVETDFYNFEALNIPPEHPARDLQDTFYLDAPPGRPAPLLRTHTSPVQIRAMQAGKPPIRVMAPGRVFRHEQLDATHSHVFHQVEGLYIDKNVSMADLKGTLRAFTRELFGAGTEVLFRPSYFPFVEPGADVFVRCLFCKGAGCSVCKKSGWLEMLGAGLVHPKVIEYGGHDPKVYTGYAFGIGVERVAMLMYGVDDMRLFYENDLRFLSQFP